MSQRSFLAFVVSITLFGCGGRPGTGTRPDSRIGRDPISHVQLVIAGIDKPDADNFKRQLEDKGDVRNVSLRSYAGATAVYELDIEGCECDLPEKIARIESPGFRYEGRYTQLRYTAFDNKPPTISFLHPEENKILIESDPFVSVEVPDQDVAEVKINGVLAERYRGNVYRAKIHLRDGVSEVVAVAKDHSGNEGRAQIRVTVDTTAPAADATLRILVEGTVEPGASVLIDGKDAHADSRGHYRMEVPIRKGQKQIEIVAIDANGNKTVTVKDIGN